MRQTAAFIDLNEDEQRQVQRATLAQVAALAEGFVRFSDEANDAERAKRQAEAYADSLNSRRPSLPASTNDEEASARRDAEAFAARWNRRHGRRDK
jgi:hypothetical protein